MKFAYRQIYQALRKGLYLLDDDLLKDIADAPYYKTAINVTVIVQLVFDNQAQSFNVPINILVYDSDIIKSILKETAYKIHKFGNLYWYDSSEIGVSYMFLKLKEIVSFDSNNYAIFHREQECGNTWLSFNKGSLIAPITYSENKRSETDDLCWKSC